MSTIVGILMLVIGLVIGGGAGFYVRTVQKKTEEVKAEEEKKRIIRDSESKAKEMLFEARSEAFKVQEEAKKDEREKRVKLQAVEERLVKKEETLDQKMESAERLKEELESKVTSVKELKAEVQAIYEQQKGQLEKVAGLTKDDARNLLLKKVEEESKGELVAYVKKWSLLLRLKLKIRQETLLQMLYRSMQLRRLSNLQLLLWLFLLMK